MSTPSSVNDQTKSTSVWFGWMIFAACLVTLILSVWLLPVMEARRAIWDTLQHLVVNPWGYMKALIVSVFAFLVALRISNF